MRVTVSGTFAREIDPGYDVVPTLVRAVFHAKRRPFLFQLALRDLHDPLIHPKN